MRYLWDRWERLRPLLFSSKRRLILLDFDGTLAPIASSPDAVSLDERTREILSACARRRDHLVVVSGRPLKELSALVRLPHLLYAGNHGLEIKGPGLSLPVKAKRARRLKGLINLLAQKFKMAFSGYEGLLVEDKNFTLSLHFRRLPRDQYPLFRQEVKFFREKYKRYPVTWTKGKKVLEIRPAVHWGKGDAVSYLLKKFSRALPVVIGDDVSDEDMFRAVGRQGITIRVGYLKTSAADYYLRSPSEVRGFLEALCR